MGRKLGAGGVALVAVVATGTVAVAAPKCARPSEVTAIQVAAIQQELMVAALTCNQVTNFNAFQTGYSAELRSSDRHLKEMFHRLFGSRGHAEYHAFKTRLANNSSIRSIHDNAGYCHEAQMVFAAALAPDKPVLANFVSEVTVHDSGPVDSCDMRVATGFAGTQAGPSVVPKPNPLRVAALTPAPAAVTPASAAPAGPATSSASAAAPASAEPPARAAAQTADAKAGKPAEKKGWLSGLFD